MTTKSAPKALIPIVFGLILADLVVAPVAHAIVGAPLTPVSAAGVARRSTRRAVVYTSTATATAAASQTAAANQAAAESAAAAQQAAAAADQAASAATQAAAAPAPTAMVASLPAGCVTAGDVFQCGSVYYKPYLSGTQVLYAQVPAPK